MYDLSQGACRLVTELFRPHLSNPALVRGSDCAVLEVPGPGRLALNTRSFVANPAFFPGGDLGRLAVSGTVNDLAVAGARPLWLTASFILEEGYPVADLQRLVESMAATAREAGVQVVAGDTTVVGRGQADGCYITTSGMGLILPHRDLSYGRIKPGMVILTSGSIGEHGTAMLCSRAGLQLSTPVVSDAAPVHELAAAVLEEAPGVAYMRAPTRGVATVLAEIAAACSLDMVLEESRLPISPAVAGACEMLGLDPLYLACEGRVLVFCPADQVEEALRAMQTAGGSLCACTRVIGHVGGKGGRAFLRTAPGGTRHLEMPAGENLARIGKP